MSLLTWLLVITLPESAFSISRYPSYTIISEWDGPRHKEKQKVRGGRSNPEALRGAKQRIREEEERLPLKVHKPKKRSDKDQGPRLKKGSIVGIEKTKKRRQRDEEFDVPRTGKSKVLPGTNQSARGRKTASRPRVPTKGVSKSSKQVQKLIRPSRAEDYYQKTK